jgi:hypothetical protein
MIVCSCYYHPPPPNVPAMKLETVEEFLRFKRTPVNTPFFETGCSTSNKRVTDVFGVPMRTEGGWKAPKMEMIFSAAISDLHAANNHTAEYTDVCDDCRAKPADQQHHGCSVHSSCPRLYRKGNPVTHQTYINLKKHLIKVDHGYIETGSMQLLPVDLRMLRTHLFSAPSITNLQTWVTIIFATLLLLRHDEFHSIHGEDFKPDLFSLPKATMTINSLVLQVFGKVDSTWVTLRLFSDNKYPELCPNRPFLVYLYLIGWKGGNIFPTSKEICDPPADGIYKTTICHSVLNQHLQSLCKTVLIKRSNMMIGCQTWRKTGYCVAIFGEADCDDLKMSARHSQKSKDSPSYSKDAAGSYQLQLDNPNPLNFVRKWSNITVQSTGNAEVMAALSGSVHKTLAELPEYFVHDILQIPKKHPKAKDVHFLLNAASTYVPGDEPEQLLLALTATMPPVLAKETIQVVGLVVNKRVRTIMDHSHKGSIPVALAAMIMPPTTAGDKVEKEEPPKKKLRQTVNDLPDRHVLKTQTSPQEKIQCMKLIHENILPGIELTSGAKTFRIRFLNPAMNCLEKHFDSDVNAFCNKWTKFQHTLFPKECCSGKGTVCSPLPKKTL